jgi:release factor glutamine methyltransferase
VLSPAERSAFEALITRRLDGEPVAYLTGRREFWGRWFAVDRRALIPRPETEHLVELALSLELPPSPRILDIGTGTGCIALTLALERSDAEVVATDRSLAALALAAENGRRLGATGRLRLLAADLGAGLDLASFDLVVSNPPYIDPADAASLSPEITRYEPASALFAAAGGTAVGERLLAELGALAAGGRVLLEIGAGQLDGVTAIASRRGFSIRRVVDDYAGIPRVVFLERRP